MQLITARNRSAAVVYEKSLRLCATLRSKRAKNNPIVILAMVPVGIPIQLIIQKANTRIHPNRPRGGRGGNKTNYTRLKPILASQPAHLRPEPPPVPEAKSAKQKSLDGRNDCETFFLEATWINGRTLPISVSKGHNMSCERCTGIHHCF